MSTHTTQKKPITFNDRTQANKAAAALGVRASVVEHGNPKYPRTLTYTIVTALGEITEDVKTADFSVANHGSICILTGISQECKDWIEQHVGNSETQTWGKRGIVIEPRYVQDIITGLESEGFTGEAL